MRILSSRSIAICIILSLTILTQANDVQAQSSTVITGIVHDEDGKPLLGASIVILNQTGAVVKRSITDSHGEFIFAFDHEGAYSIYALLDRPDTPGIDYVPSLWNIYLQTGATTSFTFVLRKGASLYIDGNVRFVESTEEADHYEFTVMRPEAPLGDGLVTRYGSGTDLVKRFGFNERLVVIPANTEVAIVLFAKNFRANLSDTFTIKGKLGWFNLSQGEILHVDIREYSLNSNLAELSQKLDSAFSLLKDAEDAGFLVTVERQDLLDARNLIDSSLVSMKSGLYDESFAKMRGAYISTSKTIDYLQGLFKVGSETALLLPFFLIIMTSALAHLVTEGESYLEMPMGGARKLSVSIRLLTTVIFFAILFSSFCVAYPGSRIASQTSLIIAAVSALMLWKVAEVLLPRISPKEKSERRSIQLRSAIISAFSMACRNLRRRKLRTVLSLTNMIVLAIGLITFTSISPGYGLVKQPLRPVAPVDALLIRSVPLYSSLSFLSLPSSSVMWLGSQQNVSLISPKAENIPLEEPIGSLHTKAGDEILVQGVIGVTTCAESTFTRIYRIVVYGEYFRSNDSFGILMSSTLRRILKVGDKLYGFGKEFVIRGFFDPAALETLVDLDGLPFISKRLDPIAGPQLLRGDQVIILKYDTALTLPNVVTSRVTVQLNNATAQEYSSFAWMVVLSMGYRVYVSHPDSLQLQLLGPFIEEKGAGLIPFLMILVVLNISASMLGMVHERRNEIATLSSVGLNPTHIVALFMAEATVVGFIGGGLGYLLGILGYRLVPNTFLGTLLVREKASAEWGLISLVLSCSTAILASVIASMLASTIVTPSLMRRWRPEEDKRMIKTGQPSTVDLPIRVMPRELDEFTRFLLERLRQDSMVSDVRAEEEVTERGPLRRVMFRYSDAATLTSSTNQIIVQPTTADRFSVELHCLPSTFKREDILRNTAADMRKTILEWNARRSVTGRHIT